ncbi:bone morphogenetic protein receptor type-2 [Nilaparvata lugens]|uniref:bone morphogenetic protein receptor type-2 n=1 Tax=Nilaparvata lugens TaxID=108931 RepID=UPI00193E9813|nr:bone morphogenetic protein receptor type-2 [Nilaparvata lugens]
MMNHQFCLAFQALSGILISGLVFGVPTPEEPAIVCYVNKDLAHIPVDQDKEGMSKNSTKQVCSKGNHISCYTLWKEIINPLNNATEISILARGCWESSRPEECNSQACIANDWPSQQANDKKFCCCTGNLCNRNVSVALSAHAPTLRPSPSQQTPHATVSELSGEDTPFFLIVVCISLSLVIMSLIALCTLHFLFDRLLHKPPLSDSVRLVENGPSERPIKLIEIIGQGRYGSLWKGMDRDGQLVAVKAFQPHLRQIFVNERDIFQLPFMSIPALVAYYGYQESATQLDLLLLYCGLGCLQDYLKTHTLDSTVFCRMTSSIARGLAHLHTEIRQGNKVKPCVCHRDLNTRNILVKDDLSCCLCDFGLAVQVGNVGRGDDSARKSISDVGTLRYMAPEVLEGAVNLRDCESSLKQIDVYAAGLVLWELGTRCQDLFVDNATVVPYALPFQEEVGLHPSFEQMQVMVSRNKARPLFPALWKDWRDYGAVRLLRETIEDCYDQDAEARLTALCIEERLADLTQLLQKESHGNYPFNLGAQIVSYNNSVTTTNTLAPDDTVESNLSEGTIETLLTNSPSECTEPSPGYAWKDSNSRVVVNPIIQPHQGRNPCLERNLFVGEDNQEADAVPLVERSMKHQNQPCLSPFVLKPNNVPPPGFIRKLLHTKKSNILHANEDCSSNTALKVTVSPFEKHQGSSSNTSNSTSRPTSLPLELGEQQTVRQQLSARIKTPGDVPPSVRRKSRAARLSLYDDRIMDQSAASF